MNNEHKNDFDLAFEKGITNKKNKNKRKGYSIEILLALVLVWAVLATLFCVYVIFNGGIYQNRLADTDESVIENYTIEELETKITVAKEESRVEFLKELKDKMLSGNGSVSMLREFFPEQIIYLESGEYKFFPISETLVKNPYVNLKIIQDEETKMIEAYDDETLVSSFGIDISKHNGEIDWDTLKSTGVEFAIMRLGLRGYGTGEIVPDDEYLNNIEGANRVGIDAGVYFFTQAITEEEAIEEADYVIENIKEFDITYPVVIDIEVIHASDVRTENLTQEERTDICIAFCERIKAAGYEAMIYGNMKTFIEMLDSSRLEGYKKWFAFYDNSIYYPYDFDIWQYSDTGTLNGISEEVDYNIIFDREEIMQP